MINWYWFIRRHSWPLSRYCSSRRTSRYKYVRISVYPTEIRTSYQWTLKQDVETLGKLGDVVPGGRGTPAARNTFSLSLRSLSLCFLLSSSCATVRGPTRLTAAAWGVVTACTVQLFHGGLWIATAQLSCWVQAHRPHSSSVQLHYSCERVGSCRCIYLGFYLGGAGFEYRPRHRLF
jgi:hypothetical protein